MRQDCRGQRRTGGTRWFSSDNRGSIAPALIDLGSHFKTDHRGLPQAITPGQFWAFTGSAAIVIG
jgi:hypothetical protein